MSDVSEGHNVGDECAFDPRDVEPVFLKLKTKKVVGLDSISEPF